MSSWCRLHTYKHFSSRIFSLCFNKCSLCLSQKVTSCFTMLPKSTSFLTVEFNFSTSNFILKNDIDANNALDLLQDIKDFAHKECDDLAKRILPEPDTGHSVIVIHPHIKWGHAKKTITTPELQLAEAVALVNTLRNWKVVEQMKISMTSFEKRTLFGKGNLEMLKRKFQSHKWITAVFINIDILKGIQRKELEQLFGVPVYDRYMIVIQIFRAHAISKEAKLQVAVAEIPYMRMRIRGLFDGIKDHKGGGAAAIGGPGESYLESQKRILNSREMKLKDMLEKARKQRALLRNKRSSLEYPVVAVVGYTNAGKSSLIKVLTGEKTIQPRDDLFATLDVTAHAGILPSRLKVLYIDTVGFISDIPTDLIEPFVATLEDAKLADVIINICDVSHPDLPAQVETVNSTLKRLNLSPALMENMIIVGNKIDLLLDTSSAKFSDCHVLVSSQTHHGIDKLVRKIEEAILKATGRTYLQIRVSSGGEEMAWLYKNASVSEVLPDSKSSEHCIMKVIITTAQLSKFKHRFIE